MVKQILEPPALAIRNSIICAAGCYLLIHQHAAAQSLMLLAALPAALIMGALIVSTRLEILARRKARHPRYRDLAPFLAPLVVLDYYFDQQSSDSHA